MFQYNEVKNPIFKYSVLAISGAAILGTVLLFITFYNAFNIGSGGSEYKVIKATTSPANNYMATSYVVMGGGAAGWCYKQVNLRKLNQPFDADKNVFTTRCNSELEVKWMDEDNLSIGYSDESLFKPETEWEKVKVTYSLLSPSK